MSDLFGRNRVTIMGVLNATPDSFSDGGRFVDARGHVDLDAAVDLTAGLVADGAHVIDVGGESTRPGARAIDVTEELERSVPVIEALAKRFSTPLSIDTRNAEVAEAALDAGATVVNDVSGLQHDALLAEVAAHADATLVLGHLRGTPATMQRAPHFDDPLAEVASELATAMARARAAGVAAQRIVADPGIGFGKRLGDNLALIAGVGTLREHLSVPILIGASRKSFLGKITGDPVGARDGASHAACAVAVFAGADAVRVHDVAGARRAVAVASALRGAAEGAP